MKKEYDSLVVTPGWKWEPYGLQKPATLLGVEVDKASAQITTT